MTISIITGVPGTGKTAFIVSCLEEEIKKGRVIFTNIAGLKLPHYRIGNVLSWQAGTWLHIDRYMRTSAANAPPVLSADFDDSFDSVDETANENWKVNPDVFLTDAGVLMVHVRDGSRNIVGATLYESHKGALVVIDECQNNFRPRPSGSAVPDHVAALEVHRHQGLDIWLVTQRPALIDSNVRGLCGRHIALRSTFLGRYKYEWPEVGDIENKTSRDTAARTRYKLPKHIFGLYKSAEVHTKAGHAMPLVAKALFFIVPLVLFLGYKSFAMITNKFHPEPVVVSSAGHELMPSAVAGVFTPQEQVHFSGSPAEVVPVQAVPVVPVVSEMTQISACIATAARCQCYNHDGIHLLMSDSECRSGALSPNDKFRLNEQFVSNR